MRPLLVLLLHADILVWFSVVSVWLPVRSGISYPTNGKPLEIRSTSTTNVKFFVNGISDQYITLMSWNADGPRIEIYLSFCSKHKKFVYLENIPTKVPWKNWRIFLTKDDLSIQCNNIETLYFLFSESPYNSTLCTTYMNQEVGFVHFIDNGTTPLNMGR